MLDRSAVTEELRARVRPELPERRLKDASAAENVVVSRAGQPALALLGSRLVEIVAPKFEALEGLRAIR
jgi:hypothetical protein